jgi:hypothetical protein
MIRFYNGQHRFYAAIDVQATFMHVCVLDATGNVVYDHNLPCHFETLLQIMLSFPSSAWECTAESSASSYAAAIHHIEAELPEQRSQAELGNEQTLNFSSGGRAPGFSEFTGAQRGRRWRDRSVGDGLYLKSTPDTFPRGDPGLCLFVFLTCLFPVFFWRE